MQHVQFFDLKEAYRRQQLGYAAIEADRVARRHGQTDGGWLNDLIIAWTKQESGKNRYTTALRIQRGLLGADITFCFIGILAFEHWGNVQRPVDLGVDVFCHLDQKSDVLRTLSRVVDLRIDQIDFLVKNARIQLGIADNQAETDISLGYLPYEKRLLERAVEVDFNVEEPLVCCSAEDLVILKSIAGRDIDWSDIRRIIQVSGRQMDWELVFSELEPLLELTENPKSAEQLRELVEREL